MSIEALSTILLVAAMATIIYGPWQSVCTDVARQFLFEIRDQFFDMARNGEISFESREYRAIRVSFEENIRYAHNLTIWRFFLQYYYGIKHNEPGQKSELTKSIEAIADPDTRAKVWAMRTRATRLLIAMMIAKSPVFLLMMGIGYGVSRFTRLLSGTKHWVRAFTRRVGETIQMDVESHCAA